MESDTSSWTSRRRLLTALSCGVPDRVPVNTYELAGCNSEDWYNNQPSYQRLMSYIREHSDCITNWSPTGDTILIGGTASILGSAHSVPIDRQVERKGSRRRTTEILHTPKGDLRHVLEEDDNVLTTWAIEHWCKSKEDVDKALSIPYEPCTYDAGEYARIEDEVGDRGLIMASLADPAYLVADLMSFQDYLMWAFDDTEHFADTVAQIAPRVMENLRRELAACTVDMYRICGPEYMTPPYLPPSLFERFMVPHVTEMTQIIHDAGSKVRLHCHGRIGQVLDMILDTDPDGIDPCEPPPDGDIELDEVKRCCTARGVSVWGNIELKLLEAGSPAEVRSAVQCCMDQAKAGGGFVLLPTAGPIDLSLSPVTEANYVAMIDAVHEFGEY